MASWSRDFLVAQVVIVVIIAVTLVFALTSEDRGLITVTSPVQDNVGPGIGIGSELTASGVPVGCSDSGGLERDCEILLSVHSELAGETELGWSENVPVSDWQGVIVRGQPARVVGLNLTTSGLTGVIPPELGEFSELSLLHLYGNDLSGGIPPEIGRMSRLDTLDLGDNQLTGPIPPELGQLPALTSLDLSLNQLTGEIPAQLGDLERLEWLVIAENDLTGSVSEILDRLPNLDYVSIEGNQFSGCIPSKLREVDGFLGDLPFCDSQ